MAKLQQNKLFNSPEQRLKFYLVRFGKVLRNDLERRLHKSEAGINPQQLGVLRHLNQGDMTLSEICRPLLIEPPTLVAAIDQLEGDGLIARKKDTSDRRRTPLAITKKGRDKLKAILEDPMVKDDIFSKALKKMSPQKSNQLLELAEQLNINIENLI